MTARVTLSESLSDTAETINTRITEMGVVTGAKALFFCMDDDEISNGTRERGPSPDTPKVGDEGIEPGLRSERWLEMMESDIEENTDRSIRNENLLKRLDWRTVWIVRALMGIFVSIVAGGFLELFVV